MRAETIAAWASSVAAFASAIAAFLALNTAWRQEEIANNQLQATYLTNLYTKQVDGVTQFENAFFQLRTVAHRDWHVPGKIYPKRTFTPAEYRAYLVMNYQESLPIYEKVSAGAEALVLTSPTLGKPIDALLEHAATMVQAVGQFTKVEASAASEKTLDDTIIKQWPLMNNSYRGIVDCAQKILSKGTPIDEKSVTACSFEK